MSPNNWVFCNSEGIYFAIYFRKKGGHLSLWNIVSVSPTFPLPPSPQHGRNRSILEEIPRSVNVLGNKFRYRAPTRVIKGTSFCGSRTTVYLLLFQTFKGRHETDNPRSSFLYDHSQFQTFVSLIFSNLFQFSSSDIFFFFQEESTRPYKARDNPPL
jgi:hypothetical protein